MSLKIALTGGIASGKTAVSNMFAQLGVNVIDADIVAREVVAKDTEGLAAIREYFGSQIINADGSLNRSLLRSIVFEDEQERLWLNDLLHPLIRQRMQQLQESNLAKYSISVIPLLFESKQSPDYDRVLVVDCPAEDQMKRLIQRDSSSQTEAEAIIGTQATREERLSIADDVIDNSKDLQYLQHQVITLNNKYLSMVSNL